eukprot:scaffold6364_cov171-Amphora_coffeaeformis.AAC.4
MNNSMSFEILRSKNSDEQYMVWFGLVVQYGSMPVQYGSMPHRANCSSGGEKAFFFQCCGRDHPSVRVCSGTVENDYPSRGGIISYRHRFRA